MTANGYRVSLWSNEKVLKCIMMMATQLCEHSKKL